MPLIPAVFTALAALTAAPPALGGVWAERQVMTGTPSLPLVGEIVSVSRTLLRVEVKQTGEKISRVEQICSIDSATSLAAIRTVIPPAFREAVSGLKRSGTLSEREGTWRLKTSKAMAVHGAKLKRPAADALPTDEDDPRLVDADRDGHPGLTISIEGAVSGSLYLVERDWSVLLGVLTAPDRVEGRLIWGSEQSVVDATNPLLTGPRSLEPHPDSKRSTFVMRRVEAKTTCADILAQSAALFGAP